MGAIVALAPYQIHADINCLQSAKLELRTSFLQQAQLYRQSTRCVACSALPDCAQRCAGCGAVPYCRCLKLRRQAECTCCMRLRIVKRAFSHLSLQGAHMLLLSSLGLQTPSWSSAINQL